MHRALCLAATVLLASSVPASAEVDSRGAREELLRLFQGEASLRRDDAVEALGTSELIVNGGFEAGQAPGPASGYSGTSGSWSWTTSDGGQNPVWTDGPDHTNLPTARTGSWCTYFAPVGPVTNTISQTVTIPSGTTATLSFWIKIATLETSTITAYDTLTVKLKSPAGSATLRTLATYSNLDLTPGFEYVKKSIDVSAWAGQNVRVHFESSNDATRSTVFVVDDVSVTATTTGPDPAATWVLPSSARVSGEGADWKTDLVVMNPSNESASLTLKFLGHGTNGVQGPERTYAVPPLTTKAFPDVLFSVFGRTSDWGPILVRSTVATLSVQGQTWTASPAGGTYGQSVPALGAAELVGSTPKPIAGVRQDASFRTNLMLANPGAVAATVNVVLLRADGKTAATRVVEIGPYGFRQLSLAADFSASNLVNGTLLVSCTTPNVQVAAYASVIDASTADPRTVLAR
jgi:hypothetical protein